MTNNSDIVDAALIIALCVCLDELHNQNKNAGALAAS
jgi:hypothetical protein